VAVFPPYPWLGEVGRLLEGSPCQLGAQACHPQPYGAFTGSVSASMVHQAGCRFVLCGHSERRQLCGETDQVVGECLRRALEARLVPVLCVGETLAERRALATKEVLRRQVLAGLEALPGPQAPLVIAYEPVWAIGTGVVATAAEVHEAHAWIRLQVLEQDPRRAPALRILYGGSVKPDNMAGLLAVPDVDGVLVGGASLDPAAFAALARARR
jgi:triosephosphate isomerase